ncbi:NAD(P)H nitroreductase [Thorsellia kenyensis]|uniref:Putative NAD(P)H nitroreductase n=1 Tax=Thorsellia kenyensis TaxID=1549888 RepID=A0ABV6CA09_9GAMM
MDAISLLLKRQSHSKLIKPAPDLQAINTIIAAGLRVPDHGHLSPFKFIIIENEGIIRLSELFVKASPDADEEKKRQVAALPFRAPLIIAVIAKVVEHPKVPDWEQIVTAGCAVHAMQMAAFSLNFGGIWRSGAWCDNPVVKEAFECKERDKIVGFLYLGTPEGALKPLPSIDPNQHVSYF